VTSAVYSPHLQAALALAYVRREHSEPGSELDSAAGPARVVRLRLSPFEYVRLSSRTNRLISRTQRRRRGFDNA
jgi:glycine cleavage system aminomethyltransferase T